MKLVSAFVLVAVAATVSGRGLVPDSLQNVTTPYTMASKLWLVQKVTFNFVDRLVTELRNSKEETRDPLLPPFDDPIIVEPALLPVCLPLDFLDPKITVVGSAEITEPLEIAGLGEISDEFSLIIITGRLNWDLGIPSVSATSADYSLNLEILEGEDEVPVSEVLGAGALSASVTDVFLKIGANLKILPPFTGLTRLELDLGFQNLAIDGGEASIDEEPIQWAELSTRIQELFDENWTDNPDAKVVITEAIRCSIDHVINGCTLTGIIGGDLTCLKIEINPECLEPLMPVPRGFKGFPGNFGICDVATAEPTTTDPTATTQAPITDPTTQPPNTASTSPSPTTTKQEATTNSGFAFVSNVFLLPILGLVTLFQ